MALVGSLFQSVLRGVDARQGSVRGIKTGLKILSENTRRSEEKASGEGKHWLARWRDVETHSQKKNTSLCVKNCSTGKNKQTRLIYYLLKITL
ncbi:Hypothetical predicted protein [Podarcis lilfordi]|nr:Hypothetical predicted protein [Podarcis lilfordi]